MTLTARLTLTLITTLTISTTMAAQSATRHATTPDGNARCAPTSHALPPTATPDGIAHGDTTCRAMTYMPTPHGTMTGDTTPSTHGDTHSCADCHSLKTAEWAVPASLFAVSALCINTSWGKSVRNEMHDCLSAGDGKRCSIENVVQYAPVAAAYALEFTHIKGRHSLKDKTILLAMSATTAVALTKGNKLLFNEKRPDTSERNSFSSGHTAMAFMGAEFLWKEYHDTQPVIGYCGYATALFTGYMRMRNNRHWINDVVAGAAVGVFSTKLSYWLYPKIFGNSDCRQGTKSKDKPVVFGLPYYDAGNGMGLNMAIVF